MIQIVPDMKALSLAAAELFIKKARESLAKGRFSVALSGGNTPRDAYELLAQSPFMDEIPWNVVHFFWGDERWVPPSDSRSNEGMARRALLDHIPVPDDQIHPIYQSGITAQAGALAYDQLLRNFFAGEPHVFDLMLLGLGENGHTASLFPHTPVLHESERCWVKSVDIPGQTMQRVTLTPEPINRSASVVFLVSGSGKVDILQHVLEGPYQPDDWPAQHIQPRSGELLWLIDQAAAKNLTGSARSHVRMMGR